MFVVSFQLKLVFRTVMLCAELGGSSQDFVQSVQMCIFFAGSNCKVTEFQG